MSNLRIYVASLADYNAGHPHGEWIDCIGRDATLIHEQITSMLAASPREHAEEYAIHDHEGFGGLIDEYTSIDTVAELAEIAAELGDDWPAYIAYAASMGEHPDIDDFRDHYAGQFASLREYAEHLIDETDLLGDLPDNLKAYFDVDSFARDLELGGDVWTATGPGGVVYVFTS